MQNSSGQWKAVKQEVKRAPTTATIFAKTAKIANTESSVKIGIEGPNTTVKSTYMTSDVIHNTKLVVVVVVVVMVQ